MVNLQGAGAYCGGLPHSLLRNVITQHDSDNVKKSKQAVRPVMGPTQCAPPMQMVT